jgi:hypothetical protein
MKFTLNILNVIFVVVSLRAHVINTSCCHWKVVMSYANGLYELCSSKAGLNRNADLEFVNLVKTSLSLMTKDERAGIRWMALI